MSENNVQDAALDEVADKTIQDTIPNDNSEVIIPIKFNKEIIAVREGMLDRSKS